MWMINKMRGIVETELGNGRNETCENLIYPIATAHQMWWKHKQECQMGTFQCLVMFLWFHSSWTFLVTKTIIKSKIQWMLDSFFSMPLSISWRFDCFEFSLPVSQKVTVQPPVTEIKNKPENLILYPFVGRYSPHFRSDMVRCVSLMLLRYAKWQQVTGIKQRVTPFY